MMSGKHTVQYLNIILFWLLFLWCKDPCRSHCYERPRWCLLQSHWLWTCQRHLWFRSQQDGFERLMGEGSLGYQYWLRVSVPSVYISALLLLVISAAISSFFSWYLQPLSEYAWIEDNDFPRDTVRLSQKRGQNGSYVDQADICSSLQCLREFWCRKIICPDVRTGRALRYSEGLSGCLSSCS